MRYDCVVAVALILNGIIGGAVLVLPIISLETGWLGVLIIIPTVGLLSIYSCVLLVKHLTSFETVRQSIIIHFRGRKYGLIIFNTLLIISSPLTLGAYYKLLIQQIRIIARVQINILIILTVIVFLFLLTLIFQNFHFGERIMAYGFLATISFIIFLIWAQITANHIPSKIPAFGDSQISLISTAVYAFSFHNLVSQILKRTTISQYYEKSVITAFSIAILIYLFVCFGCFAIQNRETSIENPQDFKEYFVSPDTIWVSSFVSFIYAFHYISVIPELSIVVRIKFLQLIGIDRQIDRESQQGFKCFGKSVLIQMLDVVIYFALYGFYFFIAVIKIDTKIIFGVMGATVTFIEVFALPIILDIRCKYFNNYEEIINENENENESEKQQIKTTCNKKQKGIMKWIQLFLQFLILIGGFYIMFDTLNRLFHNPTPQISKHNHYFTNISMRSFKQ